MNYQFVGSRLIAVKKGLDLRYVIQNHPGSTRGTVDIGGNVKRTISYFSFGGVRLASGSLPCRIESP